MKRTDGKALTALVVDNDPGVCIFMEKLLKNEGISVQTAEDGLEALSMLENSVPDIIFIDLVMPNIGGDKLGLVLRSQKRFNDTYLIVLSAISSEEEVDYIAWGFDACIAKGPFTQQGDVVLSVINKLGTEITRDSPGGVYGLQNLYKREITRELLSTKRHFELVLGNIGESIIETTASGRVVFVNHAATTLLETPEEVLLSTELLSFFEPDQRPRIATAVQSAIDDGHATPVLITHVNRTVLFQAHSVDDEGTLSVVIIGADVTEQTRAQAALRTAHDDLEVRVVERTEELKSANDSLRAENYRRELLEKQLRTALQEKEVMLDEIHHRVKNNLQVISSLLGLNATRVSDHAANEIIADMRRRVQALSLVHDRLYQSSNLAAVDAQDYFRRLSDALIGSLSDGSTRIHTQVRAEGVRLPIGLAVPCALIANEVITNSLKHAFAGRASGTISLVMKQNADRSFALTIEDDGVGIPETIELAGADTLGFRIVKVLARQIRAHLLIRRVHGARLRFEIPAPKRESTNE